MGVDVAGPGQGAVIKKQLYTFLRESVRRLKIHLLTLPCFRQPDKGRKPEFLVHYPASQLL